ncbi:hypothetical protein OM076_01075 [Solirubrobacter ginsenosidimutans]|uniref:Uncharacterized protein n=1 Tax=Solirubrobacter ginsenosidimutans TaxID=490573 RepID=A0A9X3MPG7_9ACTN|nr:hypothetical protein [Solirubrobacter ginsenosidimutans]MDA0158840.1 hypothetical protein [Solirubrobacter ginsenosidimutans]
MSIAHPKDKKQEMLKLKPTLFAIAIAAATLLPAASASAGLGPNHNETLLLDD